MYIGLSHDQNEWRKTKKQEEWDEIYYQSTRLTNIDRITRLFTEKSICEL